MPKSTKSNKLKGKSSDTAEIIYGYGCFFIAIFALFYIPNILWLWIIGGPTNPSEYSAEMTRRWLLWSSAGRSVWFLPWRSVIVSGAILIILAMTASLFRNSPPNKKVFGLVIERLFEPLYFAFAAIFLGQIGISGGVYAWNEIFVYPDLRLTGLLRAVLAFIVFYVPMSALIIVLLVLTIKGLVATCILNFRLARELVRWSLRPAFDATYHAGSPPKSSDEKVEVMLVSDLHVAGTGRGSIEAGGNDKLIYEFIRSLRRHARPKALVLAGDLTDAGDETAWDKLAGLLGEMDGSILAIPGNHDLQFRRLTDPQVTLANYLKALFRIDSESESKDKAHRVRIQERMRKFGCNELPALHQDGDLPCDFLLLDSNVRVSHSPISNAIGLVGKEQLSSARALLRGRYNNVRPLVMVLHHHVAPPRVRPRDLANLYFLSCLDASEVLSMAFEFSVSAIVHGHLHMPYLCTLSPRADQNRSMLVVSCGSARFDAIGMFANEVGGPSAYGMNFSNRQCNLVLLRRADYCCERNYNDSDHAAYDLHAIKNPSYPARSHCDEISALVEKVMSFDIQLAAVRRKLELLPDHARRQDCEKLAIQMQGAGDQLAFAAYRMPHEAGELYQEDLERLIAAEHCFARLLRHWDVLTG